MSECLSTILITPAMLRERVARMPRVSLAKLPTPLDEAARFSAALGGPRILIKREDLTGLAFGGNKTRMLEFRMANAVAISRTVWSASRPWRPRLDGSWGSTSASRHRT